MFKKMLSFFAALSFSTLGCNALQMELADGDFTFVIDDKDNSAILRDIYIPKHTKKELNIPQTVEWLGTKYVVRQIMEHAIQRVINRIESVVLPYTLYENEENRKAYNWFLIFGLPVTFNCTPVKTEKELFKIERQSTINKNGMHKSTRTVTPKK